MILLLIFLGSMLLLIRWLSPIRYAVHAARADHNPPDVPVKSHWLFAGLARDEKGRAIDVRDKFVGLVAGKSMGRYGLSAGATFVADELRGLSVRRHLKIGDIVVVDAPAKDSKVRFRLRCVRTVHSDDTIEFENSHDGRAHKRRPLSEVRAKVRYVFDGDDEVEPTASRPANVRA